jgi:nicotinate-nucleotide adenylyltransferase
MNLGILGGTFDPVHFGHLRLAEEARELWPLDRVLFVPAQLNPLKRDQSASSGEHRLAMLQAALGENPAFASVDLELARPGPSYTVDTLRALHALCPHDRLVLILGMDAFRLFPQWKDRAAILSLAHLLVVGRPGEAVIDPQSVVGIESPQSICYDQGLDEYRTDTGVLLKVRTTTSLDISATAIRSRVAAGGSIRYLTPPAVIRYIEQHGLYRSSVGR